MAWHLPALLTTTHSDLRRRKVSPITRSHCQPAACHNLTSLPVNATCSLCALLSNPYEMEDGIILHRTSECRILLYPDLTVVKIGRRVTPDEPAALELAAELGLPVPQVHKAGTGSVDGEAYIRMDYVQGERLDSVWPSMTEEEKVGICGQLRGILTNMRSLPWRTALIGSCLGRAARDCRQYTDYSDGPYGDEETFNTSFYFDLVKTIPVPIRAALYQQLRNDHRIVFSHGDLAQHNILVKEGQITGLLDWEYSGWYPEHWDYIKFFERPCKYRDWKDRAKEIFPQCYDSELAYHQAILRWQRP
ncbi:kinase-like domain-containing protein [Ampelomyces quisqualis]|uniref:Kinase-like domain-containing protein n=1 Tax=Ampelomyces quisqualis TaxID=50730 RepID=A0A6A5QUK8_AMPQU|nr:kinase-like domain-containing protein [Ampelomyces quisqualis]